MPSETETMSCLSLSVAHRQPMRQAGDPARAGESTIASVRRCHLTKCVHASTIVTFRNTALSRECIKRNCVCNEALLDPPHHPSRPDSPWRIRSALMKRTQSSPAPPWTQPRSAFARSSAPVKAPGMPSRTHSACSTRTTAAPTTTSATAAVPKTMSFAGLRRMQTVSLSWPSR